MFRVKSIFLLLLTAALFFISCEQTTDSEDETDITPLFVANFENDWLCADCGEGIIILTSIDNTLIAEQPWTGNAQVVFEGTADYWELGNRMHVTTITNTENGGIQITTNLNVKIESVWHVKGPGAFPEPAETGSVTFNFLNIPEHSGYIFSSLNAASRSASGQLPSQFDFSTFSNDNRFYLKLQRNNSLPDYLWIDKEPGTSIDVNLEKLKPTLQKYIPRINGVETAIITLYGFLNPGNHYEGAYFLDRADFSGASIDTVVLNYPDSICTDFMTRFTYFDDETYKNYYSQRNYGTVTEKMEKLNADFNFVSSLPDNFEISITGSCVQISSEWQMAGNPNIQWFVYSSSSDNKYSLPDINTPLTSSFFPEINRDNFVLNNAGLISHNGLNTYDEILETVFKENELFWNMVSGTKNRFKFLGK